MERIFIGVAWPYANGSLHLGTLAGALLPGDIFGRYQRMKGNEVLMVSGSDEHGTPITITAEKEGISPQEVVDRYHAEHVQNLKDFGIQFENFSRTTGDFHKKVVREFIRTLHKNGYIYPRKVTAFYCEHCTRFLPDRYVEGTCSHCGGKARGDQCDECGRTLDADEILEPRCKICGSEPVLKETEHLFFKLSSFEKKLLDWLKDKTYWRDNVRNFTLNFIQAGLKDRAITRDLEWGVEAPIEGYENKRIYVWFEAVNGYLSASMEWAEKTGMPDAWKRWWVEDARHYYFLAKDNIPFHTIIWPAMLMAHGGLNLPYDVPANEYLTLSGEQFSKSRGVGIWLPDIVKRFHPDAVRYYLSVNMPERRDTDWNWEDFTAKINNELVAIYGNFIHRVLTFAFNNFGSIPPPGKEGGEDAAVIEEVMHHFAEAGTCIEECRFKEGMKHIMRMAQLGNQYMNASEPWKLVKENRERCEGVIHTCLRIVHALAIASAPYMPHTADAVWRMLGNDDSVHAHRWDEAGNLQERKLEKPVPLFSKIEMNEATEDPFSTLDLRVATVAKVDDHPNADKLYVMNLDVGEKGMRQIVAGIKPWYTKEELLGKKIVVVTNLKKARIRGVDSNGMLLAVDENGRAVLLRAHADAGDTVYAEGITPSPIPEVSFDEFRKIEMKSMDGRIVYRGKALRDRVDFIATEREVGDGYPVR